MSQLFRHGPLGDSLGARKFADYHSAGLLRTVATHTELQGKPFDLHIPDATRRGSPHQALETYWVMFNTGTLYAHDIMRAVVDSRLIRRGSADGLSCTLGGYRYPLAALLDVLPDVACRTEITAYLVGATPVVDGYYSVVHRLRELRYSAAVRRIPREAECFYHWIRSRRLSTARLRSDQVFEFRAKYGTLGPFLADVSLASKRRLEKKELRDLRETFAAELDRRVGHARKVLSKAHDVKAFYLTGLISTLGALVGGAPGAFIGGIGGRLVTQMALEYDRNVPGPLSFIAETIA